MTDNMVERVARAICRAGICGPRDHIEAEVNRNWRKFVLEARAAIAAMREPTEAMLDAGNSDGHDPDLHQTYKNMIDAALSPPADDGEVG